MSRRSAHNHGNGLHARLRVETQSAHERLDGCFPDGLNDVGTYRRYLGGMRLFAAALDAGLARLVDAGVLHRHDHQIGLLDADLRALGVTDLPAAPTLLLADADEALGARYVMEGSTLGARLLLRQVQAVGTIPVEAVTFLRQHAAEPARWPAFLDTLDALPASVADGVLRGALQAFAVAEACFQGVSTPATRMIAALYTGDAAPASGSCISELHVD